MLGGLGGPRSLEQEAGNMCESAVYVVKGSERTLVMQETARLLVGSEGVTCIDTLGERKVVPGVDVVEANLLKHEILLRPRKG